MKKYKIIIINNKFCYNKKLKNNKKNKNNKY